MQIQPPLEHVRDRVQIVGVNRDHYFTNKLIADDGIKDIVLCYSYIKVREVRQ